jgi:cytochrome c oxidase subunit 2
MSKKAFILAVLLFAIVAAGFLFSQNQMQPKESPVEVSSPEIEALQDAMDSGVNEGAKVPQETKREEETDAPEEDLQGVHIMADGTIMDSSGKVLIGARILEDGRIRLESGAIITPAFDLREEKTTARVAKSEEVVVDVVGTDFEYDIKEIRVKKGDTVTINLKSVGGFHDWVLDEFDAASPRINEGEETSVTFVADTVGTFQYYCSVMSHRQKGMIGYLIVE